MTSRKPAEPHRPPFHEYQAHSPDRTTLLTRLDAAEDGSIMLRMISLLVCLASAIAVQSAAGAQRWIVASSAHFDLYTTNSEKQAREALQKFEQVRAFFLEKSKSRFTPEGRVCIVAFSSEKEYKPYRLNGGSFAYYLRSRQRDYIVMQDISPEHYQVAAHEYTHLIVEHLNLAVPVWLNEGLADIYSSLEPRGDRAMVGRALPDRMVTLLTQPWMDWNVLLAADHNSPYYNEDAKMTIFYAQSWALVHMLLLGEGYSAQFPKFLAAISSGTAGPEALRAAYGKSVEQVDRDLRSYVRRSTLRAMVFDVKLEHSSLAPRVEAPSGLQIGLKLADLLGSREATAEQARARLLDLEQQYPADPGVQESLGYLAWQQGQLAEARRRFQLAVDRHAEDSEMIYHYAQLAHSGGAPIPQVIDLLKRALALNPEHQDARLLLGLLATDDKQYGFALQTLSQIHIVKPERAYSLFSALAYCYANLRDPKDARSNAQRALQYAKTPDEQRPLQNLLEYLDAREAAQLTQ